MFPVKAIHKLPLHPKSTIRTGIMNYFVPRNTACEKIEVKNSRFIGHIFLVSASEEVEKIIEKVKEEYHSATHHCWAYKLLVDGVEQFRYHDAGEPAGTAGKPILECLNERHLINALLIVTRYFGGSKLGKGELSRAYRICARQTVSSCQLIEKIDMVTLGISFGYECESQIRNQIMRHDGEIEITDYKDKINLKVALPKLQFDNFVNICKNLCRGEIIIDIKNEPHLP